MTLDTLSRPTTIRHSKPRLKSPPPASPDASVRLTSLSGCAGCAAKLGQTLLREIIQHLDAPHDPRLLVGTDTADDAGVFLLDARRALVQTLDFFTPIVDDPFDFGRIAATNALSDVYAMGGRPLTAMNIVGMPAETVTPAVMGRILAGGQKQVTAARALMVGGHTIRAKEPIYGLSVTGIVHPKKILTNAAAQPGDLLVLTKPLGVGIVTTALKRNLAPPAILRKAVRNMTHLNTVGAALAERRLVSAATDVTGFGLMGHLASLCRASGVGAAISAAAIPILDRTIFELIRDGCVPGGTRTNRETAEPLADWPTIADESRTLLADAQTSGGLLLCVKPAHLNAVLHLLSTFRTPAKAVIGRILRTPRERIQVR